MIDEVAYSSDIVWISYGADHYDPAKFKPINYTDPFAVMNNKPYGGLWACPDNSECGWVDWCRKESYETQNLEKSFRFKLKPDAKIYVIDNVDDLVKISTSMRLAFLICQGYYCIDFEKLLKEGYDGIYVTENAIWLRGYYGPKHDVVGLNSWDVESICVFNPDVIIPIEDEPIKLNEEDLKEIIGRCSQMLFEYMDNKVIGPLNTYLKRARKKYDSDSFRDLWNKYQYGNANITTRQAFTDRQLFKNGWVIHFTNRPYDILRNGFKGIRPENIDFLWRTRGNRDVDNPGYSDEGYSFAFDANDVGDDRDWFDYGRYALMFRVSGLKVKNLGDLGQTQVIFNSKLANLKQCFMLTINTSSENIGWSDDGDPSVVNRLNGVSVINPYTKKKIYNTDSIKKAIEWVETNYQQYSGANTFNNITKINSDIKKSEQALNNVVNYFFENYKGPYFVDRFNGHNEYKRIDIWFDAEKDNYIIRKVKDFVKQTGLDNFINVKSDSGIYGYCYDQWVKKYGEPGYLVYCLRIETNK